MSRTRLRATGRESGPRAPAGSGPPPDTRPPGPGRPPDTRPTTGHPARRSDRTSVSGQADLEAGTAAGWRTRLDRAAVAFDDPAGDRQAQASPAARGVRGPPEALEDPGQILRPDAGSLVTDRDQRSVARWLGPNRYGASRWAVPDCVVDEDRDQLADAQGVPDRRGWPGTELKRDPGLGSYPGQRLERGRRDVGQVKRLSIELDRPGVGPGEQEQRVDELSQVVRLGLHVVERLVLIGNGRGGVPQEMFDAPTDDSERRAQFVAGVGGELALAPERVADRDERPPRVDRPTPDGQAERGDSPDDQDDQQELQGSRFRGPVGDHLDDVGLAAADDRFAHELN